MSGVKNKILPLLLLWLLSLPAWAAPPHALVTILQGDATLLRGSAKLALVEGARLQPEDIVELNPQGKLLRIEFADATSLLLGPGSRVMLSPHLGPERAKARAYLLAGWAKLSVPEGVDFLLATPVVDLQGRQARAVLGLLPGERAQVFAEGGDWQLRGAGSPLKLVSGSFATLSSKAKPELSPRPGPDFIQALPRPFLDTLPPRAGQFANAEPSLKTLGPLAYADAQAWLAAEPALRRGELPRWRPLAKEAEFRKGLAANLKLHPEWEPILFPPAPASAPLSAPSSP